MIPERFRRRIHHGSIRIRPCFLTEGRLLALPKTGNRAALGGNRANVFRIVRSRTQLPTDEQYCPIAGEIQLQKYRKWVKK